MSIQSFLYYISHTTSIFYENFFGYFLFICYSDLFFQGSHYLSGIVVFVVVI